jgi:hypothetical protein
MKVKFEGGKELDAALNELGQAAARRTALRALKLAATPILNAWAGGVDVQSGDLKRSIAIGTRAQTRATRRFRRGAGQDIVETFIGIDTSAGSDLAIYSSIEEFGRDNQPANPAGRKAWEEQKLTAFNRLADDLRTEITKTAERAARKRAKAGL